MRTLVLLGVAAAAVIWTDPAHAQSDSRVVEAMPGQRVVIERRVVEAGPQSSDERIPYDTRVIVDRGDHLPLDAFPRGDSGPDGYETAYGEDYDADSQRYDERYDDHRYADGRYDEGRYTDGRYHDDYDRRDDGGVWTDGDRRYDARAMAGRCGRGNTIGGAVAGGLIGGIAGNRIAGRGNRTEGTIVGGVVGAGVGAAIGDGEDRRRCERWWAYDDGRAGHRGPPPRRFPAYSYGYGYAYAYPAYYYAAPAVTTVIVEGGGTVTTTETITTENYETVAAAPTKRVYRAPTKRVPSKRLYRK